MLAILIALILSFSLFACGADADMVSVLGLTSEIKGATEHNEKINSALYSTLDFENKTEYEFATKVLLMHPKHLK